MLNSGFVFAPWEATVPYFALMKLNEDGICTLEKTWEACRIKGIPISLATTFGGGWSSIIKGAGKQSLKYQGRKVLGCITWVVSGYFGSASILLITESTKVIRYAKICHSLCSSGLDAA